MREDGDVVIINKLVIEKAATALAPTSISRFLGVTRRSLRVARDRLAQERTRS